LRKIPKIPCGRYFEDEKMKKEKGKTTVIRKKPERRHMKEKGKAWKRRTKRNAKDE